MIKSNSIWHITETEGISFPMGFDKVNILAIGGGLILSS